MRKIRVYLSSAIMKDGNYQSKINAQNGRSYASRYFHNLPVEYSDGTFFIDTLDGNVPEPFVPFLLGIFSIKELSLRGFRYEGLYKRHSLPGAEMYVKHVNTYPVGGPIKSYNVEITGTNLESVRGLYQAIVADEILPDEVDKTSVQIIEELNQDLGKTTAALRNAERRLKEIEAETESIKEICAIALQHCGPWKFNEPRKRSSMKKSMADFLDALHLMERNAKSIEKQVLICFYYFTRELTWAYRPWYKKLSDSVRRLF